MFGRGRSPKPTDTAADATVVSAADMAIDTVAAILRTLGGLALDQEGSDSSSLAAMAERWAQHVLIGAAPPGVEDPTPTNQRRDWAGVREFVRAYCRGSIQQTATGLADLRQVVW